MNAKEFGDLVEERFDQCEKVLNSKGDEYSREGDRLWNFKRAGEKRNCTPAEALMGMKVKHDVSIDDMVQFLGAGVVPSRAQVAEKIGDSINYLLLLEGLIEEERERQAQKENVAAMVAQ